eukprot:gene4409-6236_t
MLNSSISSYLSIVFILLLLICAGLVVYYSESNFPWHTYLSLTLGYFTTFAILLVIPIDIGSAVSYRQTSNGMPESEYFLTRNSLVNLYATLFTIVILMSNFVLKFEEYYNTDGYFTFKGKIISSFKRIFYDLLLYAVIGGIIFGILLANKGLHNVEALKLAAVVATNSVYQTILMFLLAYALYEFPRRLWADADLDGSLIRLQERATNEFKCVSEAEMELQIIVAHVLKTKQYLKSCHDEEILHAIDVLYLECPREYTSDRFGKVQVNKKGNVTVDSLAQLRTKLHLILDQYRMAKSRVEGIRLQAYRLEDIIHAKYNRAKVIHWTVIQKDSSQLEFLWELYWKPRCLKCLSIICIFISMMSFFGVISTIKSVTDKVSPFFDAIHSSSHSHSMGGVTFFVMLSLGYITYITVWAMFQVRLTGIMELVPFGSSPESLSFNVRACGSIVGPIAFFYLGWIGENGTNSEKGPWLESNPVLSNVTITHYYSAYNSTTNMTEVLTYNTSSLEYVGVPMPCAFSEFYDLKNVKFINDNIGTVFPIMLLIILFLFMTNSFNRILILLKMERYQFGAAFVPLEQLNEGRKRLERDKKRLKNNFRRSHFKKFILRLQRHDVNEADPSKKLKKQKSKSNLNAPLVENEDSNAKRDSGSFTYSPYEERALQLMEEIDNL